MNTHPKELGRTFTRACRPGASRSLQMEHRRVGCSQLAAWCSLVAVALTVCSSATGASLVMQPKITTQPRSVSALSGREAVLFVRAYGAGQLAFQWLRDGEPLTGAGPHA